MEEDKRRLWIIAKKLGGFLGLILILFFIFKFAVYFMPFFIAGIIALIIEPIIKFLMNKFNITRRLSSIIIITLTILIIIGLVVWGGTFLVSELIKYSQNIGQVITNISESFENVVDKMTATFEQYIPRNTVDAIFESIREFVGNIGVYIQNLFQKIMQVVMSIPTMILNIIVTILALVFFTKDRIYILDMIEYHFPKKWIKNISEILKNIFETLGSYIKAYGKILLITFAELFLSFAILKAIGFPIDNVFWLSIIIAIVDILPILGVGTVLVPWFLWQFFVGNINFGIALSIVYFIILIIRQLIEPKIVSKQLGVHPLTTLFAMYFAFKVFGFSGLIIGPIILVILICVFSKPLEKGIFKEIFEEK